MTQARSRLVSVEDTPYYHCIGRCVRRAFLCGQDAFSGQDYEHRRQWVVDRLKTLTQLFAIDVCSYAVMSNHYHVVLRLNTSKANAWSDRAIVERWSNLFAGNELTRAYLSGEYLEPSCKELIDTQIPIWRERLSNLSWFMRCLNEHIARKANEEDNCTGRFWEGRFKSQALLDETALVSCMAYVDLNPIRARMACSVEDSNYTSIQERIRQAVVNTDDKAWLVPMGSVTETSDNLPIELSVYRDLVEWTGMAQVQNKRGFLSQSSLTALNKLALEESDWLGFMHDFGKHYRCVFGSKEKIKALALRVGKSWLSGQGQKLTI